MRKIGSAPTILDELNIQDSDVCVIQTHDPNEHITDKFNSIHGKIIVLIFLEYHAYKWIEEVLSLSKNYYIKNGHLKNYFIIVHTHNYPDSLHKEYGDFFTLINEPLIYNYYVDYFDKIKLDKNIQYHFLSLNNRASVARQSLYYFAAKFNLLDKSYFSYLGELSRTPYDSYDQITQEIVNENTNPWYTRNLNYTSLNSNIPYRIENDQFQKNDWSAGHIKYYNQTFCSLVFETYDNEMHPYFTEKIWKPIAFGHPFILYSNPNALNLLKKLGFKTFGDWWDEDYDKLSGHQRLESIFHLSLEIALWPINKLNHVHADLLPVLEHNQNHFFEVFPKMFEQAKENLYNNIKKIITEKRALL